MPQVLLLLACGCSRSAPPSSNALPTEPEKHPDAKSPSVFPHRYGGAEFVAPAGWSIEEVQGVFLILCPTIEADWQANISVEARADAEVRNLKAALDALIREIQKRKADFREIERAVARHANGFEFARVEYTCRESGGVELTEWEMIIQGSGKKRLFILASSASSVWQKYRPIFEDFLQSAKLVNR